MTKHMIPCDPERGFGYVAVRLEVDQAVGTIAWTFYHLMAGQPSPACELTVSIFDPDIETQEVVAGAYRLLKSANLERPSFICAPNFEPNDALLDD
jgi:hypothetical protein